MDTIQSNKNNKLIKKSLQWNIYMFTTNQMISLLEECIETQDHKKWFELSSVLMHFNDWLSDTDKEMSEITFGHYISQAHEELIKKVIQELKSYGQMFYMIEFSSKDARHYDELFEEIQYGMIIFKNGHSPKRWMKYKEAECIILPMEEVFAEITVDIHQDVIYVPSDTIDYFAIGLQLLGKPVDKLVYDGPFCRVYDLKSYVKPAIRTVLQE